MKQYSEARRQNQDPILSVIKPLLKHKSHILEVGSGTGQHAVYFARQMPHLHWQTSDRPDYHPSINAWLSEAKLNNISTPISLDVTEQWPNLSVDAIFSANTCHIMNWQMVECFFAGVGQLLKLNEDFLLYGPFNYNGSYTSSSNANFDVWLKQQNPQSSIKHFEDLDKLALKANLTLVKDYPMPANNRLLHWRKN